MESVMSRALVRNASNHLHRLNLAEILSETPIMTSARLLRITLLPVFVVIFFSPATARQAPLPGLDEYVARALKNWECPGLAIGIVKGDEALHTKGYGVRKIGTSEAIDERTVFGIASCSKAFTATSIAMLVEEEKIKWNDPVANYLKGFQLYDPYVTREIAVRDLLCHRSGLPAYGGDFIWWGSSRSREETLNRIRFVKPASSFRSTYAYQNIMFLAAGQIIPVVTGKTWDEFVKERIFVPLGMSSSTTRFDDLKGVTDLATPHMRIEGKTVPIAWRNIDNGGPAASINSNVADLTQWMILHLGSGTYRGRKIFSPGVSHEMFSPQTIIPVTPPAPPLPAFLKPNFSAYGLGWSISEFRGRKIVRHYGETDGMSSVVALLPQEKLGVVILTNLHTTTLHTALLYRIFDGMLNAPTEDWSAHYLQLRKEAEDRDRDQEKQLRESRVKGTSPTHPLPEYTGTYRNTTYGDAMVVEENGRLVVRLIPSPTFVGDLDHWHYDTFRSKWRDPVAGTEFVTFRLDHSGRISEMILKVDNFIDYSEYAFQRVKTQDR